MTKQRCILLKRKPEGTPTKDLFSIKEQNLPDLGNDQVLLKTLYLSVDPYMRGKMAGTSSYTKPYDLSQPLYGDGLAEVLESKSSKFKKGDKVVSYEMPWCDTSIVHESKLKIKPDVDDEAALSCCGMTGQTAFIGLETIGRPKQGETCVVSGAAGAVGSLVCQILKLKGCKVIGIAGGKDKVELVKSLGVDDTIDYKSEDVPEALKQKCPGGINMYWDNVGGETLDAVFRNMATFGTIVNCGAISQYNNEEVPKGPRSEIWIVDKRLRCQGFVVFDHTDQIDNAVQNLTKMYKEGKIKKETTLQSGFDNVPSAFIDLFHGKNKGKMLVKL